MNQKPGFCRIDTDSPWQYAFAVVLGIAGAAVLFHILCM